MLREARQQRYLQPKVIYGYFPCQSRANELIIYDPQQYSEGHGKREITRFHCPRQLKHERLCLADYSASVERDTVDGVAVQVDASGQTNNHTVQRPSQAGQ